MPRQLGLPRWFLRLSARVLLAALSISSLSSISHGVHEDDCEPAFVLHDETQHHIQAATPFDADLLGEHCLACHFARSSRGPASWEPSGLIALDKGILLYHGDGELRTAPSAAPLPARAPPASA
jgi:hypothetical protein